MFQRDWLRLDALGVLTIVAYGTWFYGFGVLFGDLIEVHQVSAATLGVTYGAANLLAGIGAVATGRRLDVIGPRAVLGVIGPTGAFIYAASIGFTGVPFLVCYATGGGLIGAAGFYAFTQPLAVRVADAEPTRAITRLTIWGAMSSPIMIPLTEALRSSYGWRAAIQVPAFITAGAFLLSASLCANPGSMTSSPPSFTTALRSALRDFRIRRLAFAAFFSSIAASTLLVYQVPAMTWAGVSATTAAGLASARGLMQLAGRLPLVRAIERFGAPILVVVARLFMAGAAITILVSANVVAAVVYVVLAGVSIGALSALDSVVARSIIPVDRLGTVMGGIGLVATIGGSIGPIAGGGLRDLSGTPIATMVFATSSALVSVSIFWSMRLTQNGSA